LNVFRVSKIRLYPSASQEIALLEALRVCKDAWNALKALIQDEYEKTGKSLTCYDLNRRLPALKQVEPKYAKVHSQVLQNVVKRLTDAYKTFFSLRENGYKTRLPRFKTLEQYRSFTYPQFGFGFDGKKVQLSKTGSIKYRGNVPKGRIKTFTVKRTPSGKWLGYIVYEKTVEPFDADLPPVGVDLGLERFATLSDGHVVPIPQFYRRDERRVKKAHKTLSRKKRGSKNREKAKVKLSRVYEKVKDTRLDFLHKTSTWIADRYSVVCVEDLNIAGMAQGLRLGKSVYDASWGKALELLEYKLEERSGELIKVDPRYTSQTCSGCGELVEKPLLERVHRCPSCGLVLNRDLNAARNILRKGIGRGPPEYTPAGEVATTPHGEVQAASVNQEASQLVGR